MKLSESTISALQNFAGINQSLVFKEGSVLKTISPQKTIFAEIIIPESVEKEFAIYDLNQFLSALSLVKTPELNLKEQSLSIGDGNGTSIEYWYADKSMIITPPDKSLNLPDVALEFEFEVSDLKQALQAARVLSAPELMFVVSNGELFVQAGDSRNNSANFYQKKLADVSLDDQKFIFKVDNLKMMVLDYKVEVSTRGIAQFTSKDNTVIYFIATETKSS
jgi:hypothetical protein